MSKVKILVTGDCYHCQFSEDLWETRRDFNETLFGIGAVIMSKVKILAIGDFVITVSL